MADAAGDALGHLADTEKKTNKSRTCKIVTHTHVIIINIHF